MQRQVEELDEQIRYKMDSKMAIDKEIDALMAQKRGYVKGGWVGGRKEGACSKPTTLVTIRLLIHPPTYLPIHASLQMEVNTMAPSLEIASESPLRSAAKAFSWRLIAALITLSTSLFFSRKYV